MTPHTRQFGSGPRPVLGIHCTLAHSGAWRGMADALGDTCALHAFDLPSHGKSPDWDGQGDLHDLATDWARAQLTAPMDVIGHSFGGTVALRLAVEAPELVRSIVMIEPVLVAFAMADDPTRAQAGQDRDNDFTAALAAGDPMGAARAFNRGWGDGTKWEDIPAATRQYMADRMHFVAGSAPAVEQDSPQLLSKVADVTCPVLLIEGETANDVTRAIHDAVLRRLPQARRVVIDGAGHMCPITHPVQVAEAVQKFWNQRGEN